MHKGVISTNLLPLEMIRHLFLFISLGILSQLGIAQQTVTFKTNDGVDVTADLYISNTKNPYIILLHQAGSSRGEFREIAPKLVNLNFNCLAVDLRSGNEINFIANQTALSARSKNVPINYVDAILDIKAAIAYVATRSSDQIILLGSSYSASLALVEATTNFKVKAVVAFSPGEYFNQNDYVKKSTTNLYVPILALSSRPEFSEMEALLSHIPKKHLSLFKPTSGQGEHGAKSLWESNRSSGEYWMAIAQFFSQLK